MAEKGRDTLTVPDLRSIRERSGVSKLALSHRLNVHPSDLSKLESALESPRGLLWRAAREIARRGGERA